MKITCFGTCDMIWTSPFINGLKDSGNNILALAHSNTSMGSNIYHLIKYKDKIIESDLVIVGISEDSSRKEIRDSNERLSLYFYNELIKLNKKILVVIWHYVNMYTQDGAIYDYSHQHEKLCKHFGLNYINLFKYFKDNNIFSFYNNQLDKHHPIYESIYLFAKELCKNFDRLKPSTAASKNYDINFSILDNSILNFKNIIKTRNHLQNQHIIKLEDSDIVFPADFFGWNLISVHSWSRAVGMDNSSYGLISIKTTNLTTNLTLWGWEHIADLYLGDYVIDEHCNIKVINDFDNAKEFRCINVNKFSKKVGIIGFLVSNKAVAEIEKIKLQDNFDYNLNDIANIFILLQNFTTQYNKRVQSNIGDIHILKTEVANNMKLWEYKSVKECYKKIIVLDKNNIFSYLNFLYNIGDYDEIITIFEQYKIFANQATYKTYIDFDKMWGVLELVKFYNLITIEDLSSNDLEKRLYASYKFLNAEQLKFVFKNENIYKDHWSFAFIINAILNKLINCNSLDVDIANKIILYLKNSNKEFSKERKKFIIKNIVEYFTQKDKKFFTFNFNLIYLIDKIKDNELGGIELQKLLYSLIKTYGLIYENLPIKELKDLKVAVCMSGPLRGNFDKSLDLIKKNILIPLNADLFVHTWDTTRLYTGFRGGNIWKSLFGSNISSKQVEEIANKELLEQNLPNTFQILSTEIVCKTEYEFFKNINAKNVLIDNENIFEDNFKNYPQLKYSRTQNLNILKMFYGMQKSLELMLDYEKQYNTMYDFIIRLRPDIPILEQISLEKLQKIESGKINSIITEFGMDDIAFIGRRLDMVKLMSYFDYINSFKKLDVFNIQEDSPHDTLISYLIHSGLVSVNYGLIKTSHISFCTETLRPDFDEALKLDLKNIQDENLKQKIIVFFEEIKKQTKVVKSK